MFQTLRVVLLPVSPSYSHSKLVCRRPTRMCLAGYPLELVDENEGEGWSCYPPLQGDQNVRRKEKRGFDMNRDRAEGIWKRCSGWKT